MKVIFPYYLVLFPVVKPSLKLKVEICYQLIPIKPDPMRQLKHTNRNSSFFDIKIMPRIKIERKAKLTLELKYIKELKCYKEKDGTKIVIKNE